MTRVILMATAFRIADRALKLMKPKGLGPSGWGFFLPLKVGIFKGVPLLPPPGEHWENFKIKKGRVVYLTLPFIPPPSRCEPYGSHQGMEEPIPFTCYRRE